MARSICEINLMMLAISFAAVMQRTLLSALTDEGSLFLSALKIAAWWRQMVEVWIHMLVKMTFGFDRPPGSLMWAGKHREVLRRMLSRFRCRFQNSPLRS